MKQLALLFLFVPLFAAAQNGQSHFSISAQINSLPDSSEVSLTDLNNNTDTLAKAIVLNGKFTLKGNIAEPNLMQLNFNGLEKRKILFMGNDNITITGDARDFSSLSVSGSSTQQDFEAFQDTFDPLFQQLGELSQTIRATSTNGQSTDSLMEVYRNLMQNIDTAIDRFVDARKESPVSAFLLVVTSQLDPGLEKSQIRLARVAPQWQDGFYGKILKEQITEARLNAIGTEAVDFTQNDTSGQAVSLSSFRGKYVLVDFWASWCQPCRMENPNVVATFQKFRDKNFTILGVSLDRAKDPWLQAIADDHLTWTHVSDLQFWNNAVARAYKIESIPQNYLIGPDGKVLARNLRGPALEAKLCELLGCE